MSVIKSKAELINSEYFGSEPTFDPLTILMITKIIAECCIMIYKCYNSPAEIGNQIKNPNLATRVIMARIMTKHCRNKNLDKKKLRNIILKTDFTDQELCSIIEESKTFSIEE